MDNMMVTGEQFLDDMLKEHASEMVEYRQSGVSMFKSVSAVVGGTFFSASDVSGFPVKARSTDFIIGVLELGVEPKKGDTIVRNGELYEVYSPTDEPCWRYSGTNGNMYRIHTHSLGRDEYKPLEV
jgi:hypothetical protein